jgi:hypothetical protein
MSEQSDRILVSLPREDAEAIRAAFTVAYPDSLGPLKASLAAVDGVPEGMSHAVHELHMARAGLVVTAKDALLSARDFVPRGARA